MTNPQLSIVVPCYNEQAGLPELYRRVTAVAAEFAPYELVLINDGSRDATWEAIGELVLRDCRVIGVDLSRNHGHQLALTAGLTVCRGDRILILDADLQDPPELLPEMMTIMDDLAADVVYGQRRQRAGETAFKLLTAKWFYRVINALTSTPIPADAGDFRLISRRALDVLLQMPEKHRFIRGMVSWIGFRQQPLLYNRDPRFAGETKYPLRKMLTLAIDAVTSFSTLPLRFASLLGVIAATFSILLGLYSLGSWVLGNTVSGWTSLMATVTFIGGTQLLVTGIFGEYLGRIYVESLHRPLFIIREIQSGNAGRPAQNANGISSAADSEPLKNVSREIALEQVSGDRPG